MAQLYLNARDREYEQRFIGALSFTEDTIEAERGLHTGIYEPSISPGPNPDYWVVSGIMVSRDSLGGTTRQHFSAVLENVCAKSFDLSCWRMVELAIDNPAVEALPLSGFTPETVAEGGVSAARARHDSREQGVVPVPAVLNGGGSPGAAEDEGISKQDLIRFIQNALTSLRYEPGPIDGKLGSRTASAIRSYQRDSNILPDGLPSFELLHHLL